MAQKVNKPLSSFLFQRVRSQQQRAAGTTGSLRIPTANQRILTVNWRAATASWRAPTVSWRAPTASWSPTTPLPSLHSISTTLRWIHNKVKYFLYLMVCILCIQSVFFNLKTRIRSNNLFRFVQLKKIYTVAWLCNISIQLFESQFKKIFCYSKFIQQIKHHSWQFSQLAACECGDIKTNIGKGKDFLWLFFLSSCLYLHIYITY